MGKPRKGRAAGSGESAGVSKFESRGRDGWDSSAASATPVGRGGKGMSFVVADERSI